ncbi:tectonic-2 isoform X2 [Pseudophryne corroboree]|uniref:tectonic-2 isoform X2 n=1 Tax=Pseudophryne corroboree TaxID=495146 RepID=UPI003081849D
MSPSRGAPGLTVIAVAVVVAVTKAQTSVGFYPSTIFMSGPRVTSYLVTNSTLRLSLTVITNSTSAAVQTCSGTDSTENWSSTLVVVMLPNVSKVMVISNKNLTLCSVNETNCCTEVLCVVETLQVTACENNTPIASQLIHAEIYVNTTFVGTVSDNKTVIPNQIYQPLGSCPCNLTSGACDILCCCDQECNASMRNLFNGSCYSGIFGGNVSPPFDQLCSVQEKNHAPDWFPFLCVQSSMDNSPFLGYFYQGYTEIPSQAPSFNLSFQSIYESTLGTYKQGDAILINLNGFSDYFTIPQQSGIGTCVGYAPVTYLQDFNTTCVSYITTCSDVLTLDLNPVITNGNGGTVSLIVHMQNITMDIPATGAALPQSVQCDVIVSADYVVIWEATGIKEIQVTIVTANISLTHQGYQVGKPVIAANGSVPFVRSTLEVWKPGGDSSCSAVTQTPVLFGQNSFSGCLLNVVNENCTQLRENVAAFLKSLLTVDHVSMRGNSNVSDPSEWVSIIFESNTTCTGDCVIENAVCLKVPANMNIQIITAVTGVVEGIPQEEVLAAKVNFSTININCVSACNLSLPLTTSVQFIKVPAQPPPAITRFQMTYTEYDCEKNDVCWQKLAYPLTKYYTGEPYHLTLAKGMILVFFFISAAVLGDPWNRIRKAWNRTTL